MLVVSWKVWVVDFWSCEMLVKTTSSSGHCPPVGQTQIWTSDPVDERGHERCCIWHPLMLGILTFEVESWSESFKLMTTNLSWIFFYKQNLFDMHATDFWAVACGSECQKHLKSKAWLDHPTRLLHETEACTCSFASSLWSGPHVPTLADWWRDIVASQC